MSLLSRPSASSFSIHEDQTSDKYEPEWHEDAEGHFRIRYVRDDDDDNESDELDAIADDDILDDDEHSELEDPFSSSEVSNETGDQLEAPHPISDSACNTRNMSTDTAILADESDVAQTIGMNDNDENHFYSRLDDRKVSETFSALPDDMQYLTSPTPRSGMRSPLAQSRSHLSSSHSPSAYEDHFDGTNTSFQQQAERPTAFRSPSSVRRMQMSSPPPFALPVPRVVPGGSPTENFTPSRRGSRLHRESFQRTGSRISRSGTPLNGTPTRSSKLRKEYPLILLHCTLAPTPLLTQYPPQILQSVLRVDKQKDLNMLAKKMGPTVMERGVLITHPGEDYELLEERILESLDLSSPRIGGCGHHQGSVGLEEQQKREEDTNLAQAGNELDQHCVSGCENKCFDCGRHVAPEMLQMNRRWQLRVYAANGLMKAGAWSAAWREMEKVDVEIGIWLEDDTRQILDDQLQTYLSQLERVRQNNSQISNSPSKQTPPINLDAPDDSILETLDEPAKTARNPRSLRPQQRQDLTTLLLRYLARCVVTQRHFIAGAVVLALAIWVASTGIFATSTNYDARLTIGSPHDIVEMTIANQTLSTLREENAALKHELTERLSAQDVSSIVVTTTVTETMPAPTACASESLPAGSMVLPERQARRVLEALASESLPEECDLRCSCEVSAALPADSAKLLVSSDIALDVPEEAQEGESGAEAEEMELEG